MGTFRNIIFVIAALVTGCVVAPPILDDARVAEIAKNNIHDSQYCYEEVYDKDSGVKGKLKLFVTVGKYGEVRDVTVDQKVNPELDECVAAHVRKWDFSHRGEKRGGQFPILINFQPECRRAFECTPHATVN